MPIVTFEGVVERGQVRLPPGVSLPENARVYVVVPDLRAATLPAVASPRLAHPEQTADFAKQVIEVKPDGGV